VRVVWIVSEVYLYLNLYPVENPSIFNVRESAATLIYCINRVSPQILEVLRSHSYSR
jgi:hypothetical protein